VSVTISNLGATLSSNSSARLSAALAQAVYGDERASVWVFYGLRDGGASPGAWDRSAFLGLNTNFNPTVFSATVTNLIPNTNYYYRFYATNSSGPVWAPGTATLSTVALNPSSFGSGLKIAFPGYNRGEVFLNIPVLVRLSTNLAGFSYRQFASPAGGDLRFADSGGLLPLLHEIDEWNTNGSSLVWVRVPQLAGTNDFIRAYWGNPVAATPDTTSTNGTVWASDHHLVWHLKESSFPFADAARQHPATSGTAPLSAPGLIGRACSFNGSSQYLNAGTVNLGATFTLSAWVKVDAAATDIQTVWANKAGGWNSAGFALYVNNFQTADGTLVLETGNGTTGVSASTVPNVVTRGQWHHVVASVNKPDGSARLFVDGVDQTATTSVQPDFASQTGINLGRFTNGAFFFKGAIDEARIEAGARSSNWVWTAWMNAASNATLAGYEPTVSQSPTLSLRESANGGALMWQASGVGFAVYSATSIAPSIVWTPLGATPFFSNGQWQAALPPFGDSTRIFRLQSP
jgi:concanavalin A-like lectin/glucanase superfamily protein/uncharacterized protein DUF2341